MAKQGDEQREVLEWSSRTKEQASQVLVVVNKGEIDSSNGRQLSWNQVK
jgi:hypothetical protein